MTDHPLDRIEALLDTPLDEQCRCAPGFGNIGDDGRAICDNCGLLMLASTAGHLIDQARELVKLGACPRCMADAGQWCLDMRSGEPIDNIHPQRRRELKGGE